MARKTKDPVVPSAVQSAEALNVIPFRRRADEIAAKKASHTTSKIDGETIRLLRIADEIDSIILKHLTEGTIDPRDLAGVLSHRLGTLMRHLEEKEKLLDVCQQVIIKQAAIDE